MGYLMFLLVAITVIAFVTLLRFERAARFMEMKGIDTVLEQIEYYGLMYKVQKLKLLTMIIGACAMILMLIDLGMTIHGQL